MDCGTPVHPPRGRRNTVLTLFLAAGLFFLWTEHRARIFGALPNILVLVCPIMHPSLHHRSQRG